MPELYRSLIVISLLAFCVFAMAKRPSTSLMPAKDFARWRNLWLALTLVAFLANNFWLYAVLCALMTSISAQKEKHSAALYLFLLFAVPVAYAAVPGFGMVNYFFNLSHQRILSLCILLPAYLALRKKNRRSAQSLLADRILYAYLILVAALQLRDTTFTDTLRQSLYLLLDIYLPYQVIRISLTDTDQLRIGSLGLVLASMLLAAIGSFEAVRHWLLYPPLMDALNIRGIEGYLARNGIVRATASLGQPIALGYVMVVAIGLYLYLRHIIIDKIRYKLGFILLFLGLISPLSRGPWVGAVALFGIFILTGRRALHRTMTAAIGGLAALAIIAALPGGERIINLLPFIGQTETQNIEYRQRLIENASKVIARNPWFGSVDYMNTPEMKSMVQGQGIIDVVNSYIRITLETGFVGLGLFSTFFLLTLRGVFRSMRQIKLVDNELFLLGRCLLATLTAILVMIFTVSSITAIPLLYWSIAGICSAYIVAVRNKLLESIKSSQ